MLLPHQQPHRARRRVQDTQYSIMYQTALKASAEVTAALANAGRYKSLTDQELDQEVIERTKRYFDSVKKILENEVDLILFIDSWTEKNSKDHFAAFESEEVIYIY